MIKQLFDRELLWKILCPDKYKIEMRFDNPNKVESNAVHTQMYTSFNPLHILKNVYHCSPTHWEVNRCFVSVMHLYMYLCCWCLLCLNVLMINFCCTSDLLWNKNCVTNNTVEYLFVSIADSYVIYTIHTYFIFNQKTPYIISILHIFV